MIVRGVVLLLALTLAACATPNAGRRVMFVVPEVLPSGTDSAAQREQLEAWIVDRAGGFTEAGSARGAWRDPEGRIVEEGNRLYFVTVTRDPAGFARELRQRIVRDFDQQEAYVERW